MDETGRIQAVQRQRLSPWVTLVTRSVSDPSGNLAVYHSLSQADYVSILAVTVDGRVPLVRQFRPAVEQFTLELPGGLLDRDGDPGAVVAQELVEETGFAVRGSPLLLGKLLPDTGRLENSYWCYFAEAQEIPGWTPEPGIERVMMTLEQLRNAITRGQFHQALHVALIGLAVMRGHLDWPR